MNENKIMVSKDWLYKAELNKKSTRKNKKNNNKETLFKNKEKVGGLLGLNIISLLYKKKS